MQENLQNAKDLLNLIRKYIAEHNDKNSSEKLADKIESAQEHQDKLVIIVNCGNESHSEVDQHSKERIKILRGAIWCLFGDVSTEIIFTNSNPNAAKTVPKGAIKEKRRSNNIKQIIVVASGKGGVGKSTVATNLAATLAKLGFRTGLLDADIYGPSIPHMLGLEGQPKMQDNKMVPFKKYGMYVMSIGCIIEKEKAAIWRGPMVTKVLFQLMVATNWSNLDFLIIDTPPGTGDVHISLYENYYVDGAIIVTTPQQISYNDTSKIVDMMAKMSIPIVGIVENMSFLEANSSTQQGTRIFSGDAGTRLQASMKNNVPMITIPINPTLSDSGDAGIPVIHHSPDATLNQAFYKICDWIT